MINTLLAIIFAILILYLIYYYYIKTQTLYFWIYDLADLLLIVYLFFFLIILFIFNLSYLNKIPIIKQIQKYLIYLFFISLTLILIYYHAEKYLY